MWNPLSWFCKRKAPKLPDEQDGNGMEARRARREAEEKLDEAKQQAARVDRVIRKVEPYRDHFTEDLLKAMRGRA